MVMTAKRAKHSKRLVEAIVDAAQFFAEADNAIVNADAAVAQLEQMAHTLQSLPNDERIGFLRPSRR